MSNKSNKKYAHGSFDIYLLCQEIHGAYTGSGDSLTDEKMAEYYSMLKDRVEHWDVYPFKNRSFLAKIYDNAVKSLAEAALHEVEELLDVRTIFQGKASGD